MSIYAWLRNQGTIYVLHTRIGGPPKTPKDDFIFKNSFCPIISQLM